MIPTCPNSDEHTVFQCRFILSFIFSFLRLIPTHIIRQNAIIFPYGPLNIPFIQINRIPRRVTCSYRCRRRTEDHSGTFKMMDIFHFPLVHIVYHSPPRSPSSPPRSEKIRWSKVYLSNVTPSVVW